MPLRTGGNGKENCPTKMVEPRPKVSAKDLRRPLNERNATGEVASEKSVVEKSALVRRTQKATVTGDSRAQRTPRVDPWQEVRAAQAEAEALEVELQSLAAESESLEAQLASAEAREAEAEQQLTSQSAAMLSEYASAHECFKSLEEQLRAAREGLAMQRKENLELSRKNIELDRASRACQKEMMEAQEELEKCCRSKGAIDEQIAQQLNLCEELRTLAEGQSHRLQSDLKRFSSMKAKLLELLVAASPERQKEVQELLGEAERLTGRTAEQLQRSLKVVEQGIVPPVVEASVAEPELRM